MVREHPLALKRWQLGAAELAVVAGDLLGPAAQGILCYSSTSLTLHSAAAVRIVEQGGPVVRADAARHLPAQVGAALAVTAGRLPMRYVLVAVTNELRGPPTLEALHAALHAALGLGAALGLDSLTLPLLRARRRLDDDDLLVATLAALIGHLSGATSLRRALLVVDDAAQARLALQRLAPLLDALVRAGPLAAEAAALRQAYECVARHSSARRDDLCRELLARRQRALAQVVRLLEAAALPEGTPGGDGLRAALGPPRRSYRRSRRCWAPAWSGSWAGRSWPTSCRSARASARSACPASSRRL